MVSELLAEDERTGRPSRRREESAPAPRRRPRGRAPGARLAVYKSWEAFRIALASLRANKLRTALTLVGVVVGVAAVIAVVTIIEGLDKTVASTFSSQGSTVFTVSKRPQVITSREEFIKYNKRRDVTEADAEAVTRLCTICWRTGVAANAASTVKHGNESSENVRVRGLTLSMFAIEDTEVVAGRAWTEAESTGARDVAVVGADILDNLFDGAPPEAAVGKHVRIEGRTYEIVGVAERLGKIFGFSRDNFVHIPYPTFKKAFSSRGSLVVFVQVPEDKDMAAAQDAVRTVMRNRRGKTHADADDGFALETQDVFIDLYKSATSNIYIVTVGVAAVSLVGGGIVVMNIMLVSVTERTKEIGVRKAVGATRASILWQFLVEAVVLTGLGGVAGLVVGEAASLLMNRYSPLPAFVPLWAILVGVGISASVGLTFGLWPTWKAARLDPIEALRYE